MTAASKFSIDLEKVSRMRQIDQLPLDQAFFVLLTGALDYPEPDSHLRSESIGLS